MPRQNL
jgi:hypothetical protein